MYSIVKAAYYLLLISLAGLMTSCSAISPLSAPQSAADIVRQAQPARHVALLLPLHGPLGPAGQAVRDGFLDAYYQAKQQQQTTPTINFYNTAAPANIIEVYRHALEEGADIVIGPLDKTNVARLAQNGRIEVPTIVLNELAVGQKIPDNMLQFSLTQTDEAIQVAKQAWQAGKRNALIIVPAGTWGYQIGQAFSQTWRAQGGLVVDQTTLQNGQNVNLAIQRLLQVEYTSKELVVNGQRTIKKRLPQSRQDADMIFMAVPPALARQIKPLIQFYYANQLTVYTTSLAIGGNSTPNEALDMQDVIVCDMPWVLNFHPFAEHASQKSRFYAFGLDIYKISQNLAQLNSIGLVGKTGTLQLGGYKQINRQLICMPFNRLSATHNTALQAQIGSADLESTQATNAETNSDNDDFIAL